MVVKVRARRESHKNTSRYVCGIFAGPTLEARDTDLLVQEEVGFKERLEKMGRVVYVNAPVIHTGSPSGRGLHTQG
jgi:hypothetical protein